MLSFTRAQRVLSYHLMYELWPCLFESVKIKQNYVLERIHVHSTLLDKELLNQGFWLSLFKVWKINLVQFSIYILRIIEHIITYLQ